MFNFKGSKLLSKDIGIDLGTASVLVYVDGSGIVINEPSVVAIDKNTDCITKIGKDAQVMLGRNPANIEIVRPLREGVIDRYDVTEKMIQYFIRRAGGNSVVRPRIVICIPTGISEVEQRAVMDAGTNAGARKTYLIAEPVAAAVGAGVDIHSPMGNMIVDIGGGTTDVAVVSMGGIVVSRSIKIAGDKFNEAIMQYVRRKYNIAIGEYTAEQIKIKIGAVYEHKEAKTLQVKGRCLVQGLPKVIELSSKEMLEAMMEPISAIFDVVCSVIEETPPELVGDILRNGIILTGGGSQLYGLDRLMSDVIEIKTRVAKDPTVCVAMGTGRILRYIDDLPDGIIDLSRVRNKKRG
ncbi:MAG: rod shape-determining protein [Ruminococcaceae bacterium]|nr:rod shape-determining protein [Oscillospiraceae bacterium]